MSTSATPSGRPTLMDEFRQTVVERGVVRVEGDLFNLLVKEQTRNVFEVHVVIDDDALLVGYVQPTEKNTYSATSADYNQLGTYRTSRLAIITLLKREVLRTESDDDSGDNDHCCKHVDMSDVPSRVREEARSVVKRIESGQSHPLDHDASQMGWNDSVYGIPLTRNWRLVVRKYKDSFQATRVLSHEDYNALQSKKA